MGASTPYLGAYDRQMWDAMAQGKFRLQRCCSCKAMRYPTGPTCPSCLSMEFTWDEVSGSGEILSWVVFHRTYFDDFPAPYNVVAVRLAEGPIVMTSLHGPEPEGTWIGRRVKVGVRDHAGRFQHFVELAE